MIFDRKSIVIIVEAIVIFALCMLLFRSCTDSRRGSVLVSNDALVSKHSVTPTAPVRALDKKEISRHSNIPDSVLKDETKEVLATGTIDDASGSRDVAAVLDTKSGDTVLIEKRPFFEFMSGQEVGIGYGITYYGAVKQTYYRNTFVRVGNFYGAATIEAFSVGERPGWSAMAQMSYRW
ncbi:MAG: hypothetical protein M0R70_12630 [Nitrospirae bacterium]|nr:hypothetical protein [Nitrospirota bacterium]